MTPLYRAATAAYHAAIRLYGKLGNKRAASWANGRARQTTPAKPTGTKRAWMHCASLGEWEQGRPVLEALRRQLPNWEFTLTFFSPSGYEKSQGLDVVEHVLYLPADTPGSAERWVADFAPDLAIFVKYEFWFYHLRALHRAGVPTFLVAAAFYPKQLFFQPYGAWYRKMLLFFTRIVVQTNDSKSLIVNHTSYPSQYVTTAGDPRMDRTLSLVDHPFTDALIATFCSRRPTIIAGSVWPKDLAVWSEVWDQIKGDYNLLLAPHQLHEEDLALTRVQWNAVRYTELRDEVPADKSVLILDTIGMLSKVYRYGKLAYVGGGFKTGLHNTLEPMAYGLPTLFGPRHHKFYEAAAALKAGGAFAVENGEDLLDVLHELSEADNYRRAKRAQLDLAQANAGAGERTANLILATLNLSGDGK